MNPRSSPLRRTAIKRRAPRKRPDEDLKYQSFIRSLPCFICYWDWYVTGLIFRYVDSGTTLCVVDTAIQKSPTEFAHLGSRGLGQKCADSEGGPLCADHHRTGPKAAHSLGKNFFKYHRVDKEALFRSLNEAYRRQM